MKPIAVDCDGVLADFNEAFVKLVIEVTGKDLFPKWPFDIPTWEYPTYYGYTKEEQSKVWQVIKEDRSFWFTLLPYPHTTKFLLQLRGTGRDVYFITHRMGIKAKQQTEDWLETYGYLSPTVLLSSKKACACTAIDAGFYIDDKQENCLDVQANASDTQGFMLARPWNQTADRIPRVDSIMEFLEVIKANG